MEAPRAKSRSRKTERVVVASLQELCFTHIVMTLEEHTDKELALLPKRFREQLLHSIPVVDVCRLEGTQFISDIDTSSLWQQVYKEYIGTHGEVSSDWKINLFMDLAHSIFGDNDSQNYKYRYKDLKNRVAYLLAMKCETHSSVVKTVLIHMPLINQAQEETYLYSNWPQQTLQQKLLIPARHEKYFSKSDQILDSTVLEIISSKCLFRPKEITISINAFSQFLNILASQKSSEDILATFFEELEALTIWNEQSIDESMPFKETPSKLLRIMLSHNKGKLVALRVKVSRMISYRQIDDPTIDSITPVLSSSYNRLKTFALDATGNVSPALEKLISITEHQSELDTISVKIASRSQHPRVCAPLIWYTPEFSSELLHSWIHCCLQKPLLRHFTLCLSSLATDFFISILVIFLSTSTTHEQTLTFDQMDHLSYSYRSKALTFDFDEICTQCKSIEFNACDLEEITEPLLTLKFLKLKQLIIRKLRQPVQYGRHEYRIFSEFDSKKGSFFVSQLAQHPDFTMETLEIAEVDLGNVTSSDYDALLKKKTLQTVRLVQCAGVSTTTIREVAARQKLNIEVACESSSSNQIVRFSDNFETIESTKTTITLTK